MKKWIIMIMLVMTIGLLFVWKKEATPIDNVTMYEEKWGIKLPLPDESEALWSPEEVHFGGDGEWINAYYYNSKQNFDSSGMQAVTEYSVILVNNKIDHFVEQTISLYKDEEKINKMKQMKKEAQIGDYYFYKSESNGNDYLIALYKNDEQKLYTFEWQQ